jgi:hypothetical protein
MGYNAPIQMHFVNQITDPAPNSDYGTALTFVKDQSNVYRTAYKLL